MDLVPIMLGEGTRLFDNLAGADPKLEPIRMVETPEVTHLKYRVAK